MSVVTPTISSEGRRMDPTWQLLTLDVRREVNRVPGADLVLLDGDAAQRRFAISDTSFFEPGRNIRIQLRYEGQQDHTVFQGLVVRHGVEATGGGSLLRVGLKDAAVQLTGPRQSAVYRDRSDDEVISTLIGDAGLRRGVVESASVRHSELVRYDCTAWDFILSRADVNSWVVAVDDGTVSVRKMTATGAPRQRFEWGIDEIYDFDMEADGGHQFASLESVGWDPKELEPTDPAQASEVRLSQGNLDGATVARALGFDEQTLCDLVPIDSGELSAWASSRMARSRMSLLRGRLAVPGAGGLKLLDTIEVAGIGARFNGTTLITGLRHTVDPRGWQTDLQFGLSPEVFAATPDIAARRAAGLLPPAPGLQVGRVDDYRDDPDGELRVRVKLPAVGDREEALWARLTTPDAGDGRGYFFRPEPDDEVVVGFLNGDPRYPIILGALFGSKNKPPEVFSELNAENKPKGIVTKKGTTFAFLDDQKASVYIETDRDNKILLDDQKEAIEITDQHGNSVKLHRDGIEIESAKDLKIKASGKVEIEGQQVDVK